MVIIRIPSTLKIQSMKMHKAIKVHDNKAHDIRNLCSILYYEFRCLAQDARAPTKSILEYIPYLLVQPFPNEGSYRILLKILLYNYII